MKNWLVSLKNRTNADIPAHSEAFIKAWCAVYPIIMYYTVDMLIIRLGAVFIKLIAAISPERAVAIGDASSLATAIIKLIAVVLAAVSVAPVFIKEKPVIVHKDSPVRWFACSGVLGISAALFFNMLFVLLGFVQSSAEYARVADRQFSLGLPLGILIYGLVTPLTEEIVFRGIVYNRMRRDYGLIMALTMSSLIFGLYHGNIVQATYGFILGLIIAWCYERYGSFLIPYIIHASANTVIYIYSSVTAFRSMNMLAVCIIAGAIMTFTLSFGCVILDQKDAKC